MTLVIFFFDNFSTIPFNSDFHGYFLSYIGLFHDFFHKARDLIWGYRCQGLFQVFFIKFVTSAGRGGMSQFTFYMSCQISALYSVLFLNLFGINSHIPWQPS